MDVPKPKEKVAEFFKTDWKVWAYNASKRGIDIVVALLALVLGFPLWLLVYLGVRLTSEGPGFYCQHRVVGKDRREFTVYKFRTMHHNSDDSLHKDAIEKFINGQPLDVVERNGEKVHVYKLAHDSRVTGIGRILRKTGIDEVPQFVNVLRGDMSLVGPRPPLYYEYELYNEYQAQRLAVLPGITGLYQVTGRSQVEFKEMVEMDLDYIRRRSLWLDLWIMLRTPWVMITGKGAH